MESKRGKYLLGYLCVAFREAWQLNDKHDLKSGPDSANEANQLE